VKQTDGNRSTSDDVPNPVVFLVDVDNTLLDNDRIQDDLRRIDELLDVELAVLLRAGRATG
jgi:hypothetical protein